MNCDQGAQNLWFHMPLSLHRKAPSGDSVMMPNRSFAMISPPDA